MDDITSKQITLRTATAVAVIFCCEETISLIKNNELPKGNLFSIARAAGFLGAKLTPQLPPHCHPASIDSIDISFDFISKELHEAHLSGDSIERPGIIILAEAKSIGRAGIEMETLTAVSIAALEIYEMLKPADAALEIGNIKLLQKKGSKSVPNKYFSTPPTCAILVCSDSTAAGKREDRSGMMIRNMLEGANANVVAYEIVPDDTDVIQKQILKWVSKDIQFIFTTGGTGLGPRDNTVTAVTEILERDANGITEAMRNFGQMRTPMAMMSRAVAGSIAHSLIITLPGSTDGARESLEAILPGVFHARKIMKGGGH